MRGKNGRGVGRLAPYQRGAFGAGVRGFDLHIFPEVQPREKDGIIFLGGLTKARVKIKKLAGFDINCENTRRDECP